MKAMLKKVLSFLLVVTLTAGIAVGGTLAYLTDRDSKANVFTVGDVDISLEEKFEQDSPLLPGLDVEKDVQIKNEGPNDAWVWYTYAIPQALDTPAESSKNVLHVNHAGANWLGYQDNQAYWAEGQTEATPANKCWIPDYNPEGNGYPIGTKEVDGVTYNVYAVLYNGILPAGETTTVGMTKVYFDTHVDVTPEGDMHWVENGVTTDLKWNINTNPNPVIFVNAYAMQTNGFATVQEAYAAFAAQWGGMVEAGTYYVKPPVEVPEDAVEIDALEDLKAAAANGGNFEIVAPITVNENIAFNADVNLYNTNPENVLSFENNAKLTVNANKNVGMYGVKMDGNGTYSFDADGKIQYDADARRTTPLLNVNAGATLTLGTQTEIANVVAKGSAVLNLQGNTSEKIRAKAVLEYATITNCAGESGAIINVAAAGDVVIGEGTEISNNASYNNNNHGIIRVYNSWDAENPSTVTMNGGKLVNNYYSGNGMIGLYYGKFIMNGGKISENSWFADNQVNNGWYPVVYVHTNSVFEMNGGSITDNTVKYGVINSLNSALEPAMVINGGTIKNNPATNHNNEDALAVVMCPKTERNSLVVSENADVAGTVWVYYKVLSTKEYDGQYHTLDEYLGN